MRRQRLSLPLEIKSNRLVTAPIPHTLKLKMLLQRSMRTLEKPEKKLPQVLTGEEIDRRKIVLDKPIKETGVYDVAVKLFQDVSASVKVKIEG